MGKARDTTICGIFIHEVNLCPTESACVTNTYAQKLFFLLFVTEPRQFSFFLFFFFFFGLVLRSVRQDVSKITLFNGRESRQQI